MVKNIVISLGKKYVIGSINDLLEKNKDDVTLVCDTVSRWIDRLQMILGELQIIQKRIADGKIDDDEVADSKEEISTLISEWK